MAIIKCPECGKDVSDQAPQCIHCGYPLKQTNQGEAASAPTETNPGPYALVLHDVGSRKSKCGNLIVKYAGIKPKEVGDLMDAITKRNQEVTISINRYKSFLDTMKEDFDELQCGTEIVDMGSAEAAGYNFAAGTVVTYQETEGSIPKCPTCGSSRVSRIGNINRGVSVMAFGMMSKKINKSFKCNNCGFTW